MNLTVNGEGTLFDTDPQTTTVAQLLVLLGIDDPRGMAVAVNQNVISKRKWTEHTLHDGDEIEIIRATQGG